MTGHFWTGGGGDLLESDFVVLSVLLSLYTVELILTLPIIFTMVLDYKSTKGCLTGNSNA